MENQPPQTSAWNHQSQGSHRLYPAGSYCSPTPPTGGCKFQFSNTTVMKEHFTSNKQIHCMWPLTPMSNTYRASAMAWVYVAGSVQLLPTWKLTPMMSRPSSFARSRSSLLLFSVAPNFTLSLHTALESSVAIRSTSLHRYTNHS